MTKTPLERSNGARMERAAMRSYLRRKIKESVFDSDKGIYMTVLDWVLTRQKRYKDREGGL